MKCFYHESDMDGWCSGAIVAKFTNNYNAEDYIGIDYSKNSFDKFDLNKISDDETIYISDISFTNKNIKLLDKLIEKCGSDNIIWNDHHKSSIELCESYDYLNKLKGKRDDKVSGAYLTWQHFTTEEPSVVVKYVSDWDCFLFKFKESTRYFKYGIDQDALFKDPLYYRWVILLNNDETSSYALSAILRNGHSIDSYLDSENKKYLSSYGYESFFEGHKIAVLNKAGNSLVFGKLYEEYPIVSTFVYDGEDWNYSIYSSNEHVDCSAIAKKYGGGGHKGAAGFKGRAMLYPRKGDFITY